MNKFQQQLCEELPKFIGKDGKPYLRPLTNMTEEELRTVIGIGVNLIQGFYTGRPGKEPVQKIDDEIRSKIRRFSYGSVSSIIPGEENN